jgi:hypothetical protein
MDQEHTGYLTMIFSALVVVGWDSLPDRRRLDYLKRGSRQSFLVATGLSLMARGCICNPDVASRWRVVWFRDCTSGNRQSISQLDRQAGAIASGRRHEREVANLRLGRGPGAAINASSPAAARCDGQTATFLSFPNP